MKKFYPIFLVVALAALAVAATFWRGQNQTAVPAEQEVFDKSEEVNTSNWKIYESKEMGFQISHPENWVIKPYKESIRLIYDGPKANVMDTADMTIQILNISLDKFIEVNSESAEINKNEQYFVGNIPARKLSMMTDLGVDTNDIFIERDGKGYVLSYFEPFNTVLKQELDNIISTFKFLDTAPLSTAEWKTYKNNELGFAFEYPDVFGDVNFSIRPGGDSGTVFLGTFTKNDKLMFGGISSDFAEGRGGSFLDAQGYEKDGNQYFHKFVKDTKISIPEEMFVKEISSPAGNILIITGNYELYGPGGNNYGALINLPHNIYSGMAFLNSNSEKFSLPMFERMLSAFKFVK